MPIYTWQCSKCADITEVSRSMKDYNLPPDQGCKTCQSKELKKTIEPTKFILQGEGWYHNSYTSTGKHIKS